MRAVDALAVSILILGSTGCASLDSALEPKAGQELRPFAVGWEQFFTIDWQPTERKGQPALEGMVVSRFGATATRVQLLVEGLDESGRVVGRTFTTATCGTGCRGTYSAKVRYHVGRTQPGTVMVFEASAEDGRPIHVQRVAVTLTA